MQNNDRGNNASYISLLEILYFHSNIGLGLTTLFHFALNEKM